MKAMITGASSGIGKDIAINLAKLEFDLILIGRDKDALEDVKLNINKINDKVKVKIIVVDLSNLQKVKELYVLTKNDDIDLLVNNAGFGDCGNFTKTSLEKDINMIKTNIIAYHILTKLYLTDMKEKKNCYS